jgi:hypothetical protein
VSGPTVITTSWPNSVTTSNPNGANADVRLVVIGTTAMTQPTIERDAIGRLSVQWAHPTYRCEVRMAPEVLEQMVKDLNELALRRLADSAEGTPS